MPLAAWQSYS
jgi:hypothetical protein